MAQPKKGALHQIFVTMVDSTDFASVESAITASDFNSGVTAKFYGMNTGGSAATTSGTISKTASLVHSGVFRITLKTTENNYDLMQVRFNKTGCAEQIIEWQNVDNDDSDLLSAISIGNSRVLLVQSQLSDAYSQLSDFRSDIHSFVSTTGVGLHASALSDIRSAIAAVTASVSASDMSDIRSAITAAASDVKSYVSGIGASSSDVASAVNVELGSRLSDILSAAQQANSRVLVIQSMTSDLSSQMTAFQSDLNSVITTTGVQLNASTMSDLRSAITASTGSLSASDISDIASAVIAAIGATGVALDASTMSDIRSAVLLVQSMASDAASAAQQANSRVLLVQSLTSDVASQITAFQSDLLSLVNTTGVALNASTISDLRSAITAATGDTSVLSDILSAAQQANSRILVAQSGISDVASAVTAGVTLNASGLSDVASAVWATTRTEPTAVVSPTGTMKTAMEWLVAVSRNKLTQTATVQSLRNDADSADIASAAVSDDATTFIRGEFGN